MNDPSSTLQLSPVFFDSTRAIRAINLIRHPYCPIYSINRENTHRRRKKWVYNHTKVKTLKLNFSFLFIARIHRVSIVVIVIIIVVALLWLLLLFNLHFFPLPPRSRSLASLSDLFQLFGAAVLEIWILGYGDGWRVGEERKASNNWTCRSSNLSTSVPVVWCVVYDCTMREFLGIFKLIGISASLNPSRQRAREMILIY